MSQKLFNCLLSPYHLTRLQWKSAFNALICPNGCNFHERKVDTLARYFSVSLKMINRIRVKRWAPLDTHDTLTDAYKHLRDCEQIAAALRAAGMVDIHTQYAGNGVEAQARKPLTEEPA